MDGTAKRHSSASRRAPRKGARIYLLIARHDQKTISLSSYHLLRLQSNRIRVGTDRLRTAGLPAGTCPEAGTAVLRIGTVPSGIDFPISNRNIKYACITLSIRKLYESPILPVTGRKHRASFYFPANIYIIP